MKTKLLLFLLASVLITPSLFAQALGYNHNRIAISADGNNQPDNNPEAKWPRADPDDWGATPAALAMIAKLELQDKLVHYSYNNFIGAPPHTSQTNYMADGVNGAIERWSFDPDRFFDVPEDNATAIAHLANELKKSTAADPLYFIHMGPSEFFYRAVKQVVDGGNADALAHVFVISHSGYNDNHLRRNSHHTMAEAIALSGDRIQYKKIADQNACDDPNKLWCSGTDFTPFYWMRDHIDEGIRFLYSRTQFHPSGKGADLSDAGMVWYLLKGDEYGNLSKFKTFIGNGIANAAVPQACTDVTWVGIQDFEMAQIDTFVTPYKDNGRNAVAVNAGMYKNRYAATQKVFEGSSNYYDITLTSLTEEDGESTYRVRVNGNVVGEFQNPANGVDMAAHTETFKKVLVRTGDVIQIESNSHSNGKIPEGDGFAFSRGRWRSISFTCLGSEDCQVEEKDGLLIFEAERMELKGQWKLGKDEAKASGGEYIYYDGPNSYQAPNMANHISYTFKINKPGNYTVKWTMRQPEGERGTDQGNDVFIFISDNYGYGGTQQLTEYEKYYSRSGDDFVLDGIAEVHGLGHKWLTAKFPSAGEYTINFVGRSHGLQIDRIVMFSGKSFDQVKSDVFQITETSNCSVLPPAEDKISSITFPQVVPNKQTDLNATIAYLALETRKLHCAVLKPDGTVVATEETTVDKGTGNHDFTFTLGENLAVADGYTLQADLLPVDGTLAESVATKNAKFNVIDGDAPADKDAISYLDVPTKIAQNILRVPIKVRYSATEARDVNIEVKQQVYVTNSLVTVPAGYGDTTIVINFPSELDLNLGYTFILSIRPVGGDWKTNITKQVSAFTILNSTAVDSKTAAEFKVFPNPFSETFSFTNNGQINTAKVYDLKGNQVFSHEVKNGLNTLSLANCNAGIYFLELTFKDQSQVKRKIMKL